MKVRHCYLALAVVGLLLPYWQLVPWLVTHGLNLSLFFRDLFVTRISGFFGLDVIVSAIVLVVFVAVERRRLRMSGVWLPIVGVVLVGVSFALPLFLYLRERHFERSEAVAI